MPSFSTFWNPYDVLSIDNSRTRCCGWAPSKGRGCQNPIALANREEAQLLLAKISRLDPASPSLSRHLQKLARLLLCQRNHQNQATGVVRQWENDIQQLLSVEEEEEIAEEEEEEEEEAEDQEEVERDEVEAQILAEIARQVVRERRRQGAAAPSLESSIRSLITRLAAVQPTASQPSSRSDTAAPTEIHRRTAASAETATSSTASQGNSQQSPVSGRAIQTTEPVAISSTPTQTSTGTVLALETTLGDNVAPATPARTPTDESLTNLSSPATTFSPPASPTSTPGTSVASFQAATEAETVDSLQVERGNSPVSDEPSSDILHPAPAVPVTEQTSPEEPVPTNPRTLSGDCSICYEELVDGRSIVPCRTQCRQYYHQRCIDTWLREGTSQTCPYWYVVSIVGLSLWLMMMGF
ncbi:MAG: hypothetical protein Q9191_004656 [Dirinaria sp. TL-2023a]